jgi:hypothetical protein
MITNDHAMLDIDQLAPRNRHAVASHLARGAIGFGLIGCALALTTRVGPASLLLLVPGMVALRGCPTCWFVGLIETVSAGRLERTCADGSCTLTPRAPAVRMTLLPGSPVQLQSETTVPAASSTCCGSPTS